MGKNNKGQRCSCGRDRPFSCCCGPYLRGEAIAPTAEALMRSRYSAFCQRNLDYLLATQHPDYREAGDQVTLARTLNTTRWLNLIVLKTQQGQRQETTGTVEFVAAYRPATLATAPAIPIMIEQAASQSASQAASQAASQPAEQPVAQLHERSQFVQESGRWFYTTGEILPPHQPKRGQACWCGSAKKYKQCHGAT